MNILVTVFKILVDIYILNKGVDLMKNIHIKTLSIIMLI